MGKLRNQLILTAALLAWAGGAQADNFWVGVRAGTAGIGLEGTWRPIDWVDLRLGYGQFSYKENGSQAGVNYDGTLDLESFYGTVNFRFPLSPFRVSLGAYQNGNSISLVSDEDQLFNIGGIDFPADQVGTLTSETTWDDISPYAGFGFDFELVNRIGLNLDFGVMWQGDPYVTLQADGPLASDPLFTAALEQERQELAEDFDALKAYPVVSLAFNFNF